MQIHRDPHETQAKDEAAVGHADAAKRAETLQELLSKEAATGRSGSFFFEECHQYTLIYNNIQIYSNIYI